MGRPLVILDAADAARPYERLLRPGASLEAALRRPGRLHDYTGEADPVVLAACLLWAVTRAHPLLDGNKRASIVLADDLLAANGLHLDGSDDDLVALALDAAAAAVGEGELLARMRALVVTGSPPAGFAARHPRVIERLAA